LEFGYGQAKNLESAVMCYQAAAAAGGTESEVDLGFCLEHFIVIEENVTESMAYYQRAADQQNSDGLFHCALILQYGMGFDVDLDEAASYYLSRRGGTNCGQHSFRCLRCLNKAPACDPETPRRTEYKPARCDD
jgi:hypothetical protein